ncbi:Bax inhibitor-1/YccA family protein [Undibacterium sp. Xuan67W]|uniref:Bax inhibitor-1/YccA family protein n=1 Tax=Undibacterium sp. Xuan67W TaxID=3413057 RepID=UPI003BEFE225
MKILDRSALRNAQTVDYIDSSAGAGNKVLRNTYMLLSMTLLFSALTAAASVAFALPGPGIIITLVGYFGLLFLTTKFRNSGLGLLFVFALTGFMGLTIGPVISRYLGMPGGSTIVMGAMGLTGLIFLGLSAYVLVSKRDFSFMGGFLMIGMLVAFVASLGAIFFQIPALSLTISAVMVLLMSGMILFETSNIIRGGETNYIMATVSLYITIFNLFMSLLQLLGFINEE